MELKIINSDKNMMELELGGETHTFVNFLRDALWSVKGVKDAGYRQKHPLVSDPRVTVRTDGLKPKKAFEQALSLMKSQIKDLKTLGKKLA